MKISEKSIELIELLRRSPGMLVPGDKDFYSIKCFLIGYIMGIETVHGIKLYEQINIWFKKKINQKSSLFWTELISDYYKGKNDRELTIVLLDELKNFFIENPTCADF